MPPGGTRAVSHTATRALHQPAAPGGSASGGGGGGGTCRGRDRRSPGGDVGRERPLWALIAVAAVAKRFGRGRTPRPHRRRSRLRRPRLRPRGGWLSLGSPNPGIHDETALDALQLVDDLGEDGPLLGIGVPAEPRELLDGGRRGGRQCRPLVAIDRGKGDLHSVHPGVGLLPGEALREHDTKGVDIHLLVVRAVLVYFGSGPAGGACGKEGQEGGTLRAMGELGAM